MCVSLTPGAPDGPPPLPLSDEPPDRRPEPPGVVERAPGRAPAPTAVELPPVTPSRIVSPPLVPVAPPASARTSSPASVAPSSDALVPENVVTWRTVDPQAAAATNAATSARPATGRTSDCLNRGGWPVRCWPTTWGSSSG